LTGFLASVLAILASPVLLALPATLSLPWGRRPGLQPLTLDQAAADLQAGGRQGWELVEAARFLVAQRMNYCRRNSFDPAPRAFARGYGYCQQQAYSLVGLLARLGIQAKVVHALRNHLPDGRITAHAWVRVEFQGQTRDIDSTHYNDEVALLDFEPLSPVHQFTPAFRLLAGWGSAAVNALRYYQSGKDH
jgi:transglutaminase-like putative cysteine protease